METHNATIARKENSATLKLEVGKTILEIILTDDNPNAVKNVFNSLLSQLKTGEFHFKLEDDKADLYHHVCKEYIIQLNSELASTFKELQDNNLVQTLKSV